MLTIDERGGRVILHDPDGGPAQEHALDTPEAFEAVSAAWLRCGWDVKYVYGFTWMGRPVIQLPGRHDPHPGGDLAPASRRDRRDRRRAWRIAGVLRQPVRRDGRAAA